MNSYNSKYQIAPATNITYRIFMERKTRIDALGAILLIIIMLSLGLNQVGVKLVNEGMAPIFQAGLRSLAASPLIFLYCLWKKSKINLTGAFLIPGIITGIFFALEFTLLFQSVQYTSVARASIFFYTMPFWVALAAHFLIPGEQLTPIRIAGLLLAGLGVVIALSDGKVTQTSEYAIWGDIMALIGATLWAGIAIIARTTSFSKAKPEVQLFYQVFISALILMPVSLYIGDTFREPTTLHFMIFSAQIIFVVCMGFLAWFWVLSIYPASDMASFSFLSPVFAVFFGWYILNETLSWSIIIALFLVGIGIILVNQKPKAK